MVDLIPRALPGELLFSRLIRGLTLSGGPVEDFLEQVLGKKRGNIHPFLTSGLDLISKHCPEPPRLLLKQQTLAPLFMHFLPKYQYAIQKSLFEYNPSKA